MKIRFTANEVHDLLNKVVAERYPNFVGQESSLCVECKDDEFVSVEIEVDEDEAVE